MQPQLHQPWVAYVGPFGFPNGGAAARRILGNAQSLVQAGYHVTVVSGQTHGSSEGDEYRPGIRVVSVGERTVEHWPRPLRRFRYAAMGDRTRAWLHMQEVRPAAVILYSGYSPYLLRLLPWCRREGIPLIFDAVEWYEADGALGSLGSPYQWNIELAMRFLIKRTDGVIAISRYLTDYFRAAGSRVATIPPTLDMSEVPLGGLPKKEPRLQLCYAGTPGTNKDLIDEVVGAVVSTDPNGHRMILHIAGVEESQLLRLPSLKVRFRELPPSLQCHGILSQVAAMSLVHACDFTVLLRPDNRVARAGFSTKFVESLAVGTPVIANITGDLGSFLHSKDTGLVAEGWSAAHLCRALDAALSLSRAELEHMRIRCREVAIANFDFRAHTQALKTLIQAPGRQTAEKQKKDRQHHADA